MKEIHAYKKVNPGCHLIIVKDKELEAIRKKSKEYHAHLPENNTERVILSCSVSSDEAGVLRIVAARSGKTLSAWLREAGIFKAFRDELTPAPALTESGVERMAGEILGAFLG